MEPGSDQFEQRAIYEAKRYRVLLYSQERLEYSTHSGVIASLTVKKPQESPRYSGLALYLLRIG